MLPVVAAPNVGMGSCRGDIFGDMLEAMTRIAPSLPNEVLARFAPRKHSRVRFFGLTLNISTLKLRPVPVFSCLSLVLSSTLLVKTGDSQARFRRVNEADAARKMI